MIRPLAAVAALMIATPCLAQEAAPAPVQEAAPDTFSVSRFVARITAAGLAVSEVRSDDTRRQVTIQEGPLTSTLTFFSCEADACGDAQFSAGFSNAQTTLERVNQWNTEHRFLKAYHAATEDGGTAVVQYDVIANPGGDVAQIDTALILWRGLLTIFARHVGYLPPEPEAADPAQ